jgi:hypothetical protein
VKSIIRLVGRQSFGLFPFAASLSYPVADTAGLVDDQSSVCPAISISKHHKKTPDKPGFS